MINLIKKVFNLKPEAFVFWITTFFYFSLWFINPGNKIVLGSFLLLLLIFYFRLKNIRIALLLTYLVSIVVLTGKTYTIQHIPTGVFPVELYPSGVVVRFIVSPKHILAFLMFSMIFRDLVRSKLRLIKINKVDVTIACFFLWMVISDIFGSRKPEISLLFSLTSLEFLIFYFYLRIYSKTYPKLLQYIFWLLIAIVIFQSIISLEQFTKSSPVFKGLENQIEITYSGWAPDELQFRFRPLGTFPHANILGTWLSFLLSLVFVGLFKKPNYFLLASFILGLTILVVTLSRSSWLGYLVSVVFILYVCEKIKKIKFPPLITKHFASFSFLAIFLLIFFILPRANKSLYSFLGSEGGGYLRLAQAQETVSLITRNPFFGVGSAMTIQKSLENNPRGVFSSAPITVHNWYLLVAAEHGLPALVLFLIFVILSVRRQVAKILAERMINFKEYLALGFLGGVLALLVSGLFQNYFVLNLLMLPLGVFTDRS